jgi:hypothetical protein
MAVDSVSGYRRLHFYDGVNPPQVVMAVNAVSNDTLSWIVANKHDNSVIFLIAGSVVKRHDGVNLTDVTLPANYTVASTPFYYANNAVYIRGQNASQYKILKIASGSSVAIETAMSLITSAFTSFAVDSNEIAYIINSGSNQCQRHNLVTGSSNFDVLQTTNQNGYNRDSFIVRAVYDLANNRKIVAIEYKQYNVDMTANTITTGFYDVNAGVVANNPIITCGTITISNTSNARIAHVIDGALYCLADHSNFRKFTKIVDGVASIALAVRTGMSDNIESLAVKNKVVYFSATNSAGTSKAVYSYNTVNEGSMIYDSIDGQPFTTSTGYVFAFEDGRVIFGAAKTGDAGLTMKYIDSAGVVKQVPLPTTGAVLVNATQLNFTPAYFKNHHYYLINASTPHRMAKVFINF